MQPKTCLITIGFTHSGKTTLANKLCEQFPELTKIDTDVIRVWQKQHYPKLVFSDYNVQQSKLPLQNITFRTMKTIAEFAFEAGVPVIFSNGNIIRNNVDWITAAAKQHRYRVITLYVDTPEEVILERISTSNREHSPLTTSKDFYEVLERQKGYADFDFLAEVKETSILVRPDTPISEVIARISSI